MKRVTLLLDRRLLEEAMRLSGGRSFSATVRLALEEYVRKAKARQVWELAHSGVWEGELSEMRSDDRHVP